MINKSMQTIDNKYTRWYYNIIKSAQNMQLDGYTEKHHIVPKSLGGTNDKENLVKLTPRQHFLCHRLLVRMLTNKERGKMIQALWYMSNKKSTTKHIPNARIYDKLRIEYSAFRKTQSSHMKGKKHTEATKQLISQNTKDTHKGQIPWNKGMVMDEDWQEKRQKGADEYRANNPGWDKNWKDAQRKAEPKRLKAISKQVVINGSAYSSARAACRAIKTIKYITLIKRIKSKNFPEYNWSTT